MTTREILVAARALIDAPEKWTQGAAARAASKRRGHRGRRVTPQSRDAVSFCAIGAIGRACADDFCDHKAINVLQNIVGGVSTFNDTHTHAEVLAAFDEAIARLDRGEV